MKIFLFLCIIIILWVSIQTKKNAQRNETNQRTTSSNQKPKTKEQIKGERGELLIYNQLSKIDIGYKKILKNVYLFKNDNYETTEIDLLMIHSTGIYVFESKNYSGWIFGDRYGQQWTQCLNKRSKYKLYNPIKQNIGHINALKRQLNNYEDKYYISYIVFGRGAVLKKVPENTDSIKIVEINNMLNLIQNDMLKREKILNNEKIDEIYEALRYATGYSDAMKEKHIHDVSIR